MAMRTLRLPISHGLVRLSRQTEVCPGSHPFPRLTMFRLDGRQNGWDNRMKVTDNLCRGRIDARPGSHPIIFQEKGPSVTYPAGSVLMGTAVLNRVGTNLWHHGSGCACDRDERLTTRMGCCQPGTRSAVAAISGLWVIITMVW